MCIYDDCKTPNKMYLTSDELLKHMRSQHGVACWVCDYCASKPEADQRFIFKCLEDWEFHMKKKHNVAFPPSRLRSLAKVSERKMLESLACPLCGYAAEHLQPTLDDHIAKHLHGFALRCLPWGTGGNEKDSVNAKSADASDSSELNDENGEGGEPAYLDVTEADTPTQLYEILKANTFRLWDKPHPEDCTTWPYDKQPREQLLSVEERFLEYLPVAESIEKHQSEQLALQRSHILALADLFAPAGFMHPHEQSRMSGKVRSYTLDPSSIFPKPENRILEALGSHMMKIAHILYQADLGWRAKRPSNAFELYCEKTLPILGAEANDDSLNIKEMLAQGWKDLPNSQRDEFQRKIEVEEQNFKEYEAQTAQVTKTMLEDELDALETNLLEMANSQGQEHSNKALDNYLNKATRLWNAALTLEDSENYEEAERRHREAILICEREVGNDHPHTLMGIEKLALMCMKSQQWKEAEELLVQVIQIRKRVPGAGYPNTLSGMAKLALTHRDQDPTLNNFASRQDTRSLSFKTVVHFVDFCKRLISIDGKPGRLAEAIDIDGKPVPDSEHAENQFRSRVVPEYIYLSTKVLAYTKVYEGDMSYPSWTWESLREGLKTSLGGEHDMIQFETRLMNLWDMILAHYSLPPL
jgi:tetratricopeptide (TPR) repeat protein